MPVNNAMTADFLRSAYGGESMAHMRPVCGHTVLDHAPDNCPICGTKREMYKTF